MRDIERQWGPEKSRAATKNSRDGERKLAMRQRRAGAERMGATTAGETATGEKRMARRVERGPVQARSMRDRAGKTRRER